MPADCLYRVYNEDLDSYLQGWVLERAKKELAILFVVRSAVRGAQCRRTMEPERCGCGCQN